MRTQGIQAESLTHQVLALLKRRIASGRLRPGERILEKELCREIGISRTPVREALLKLEANGLVVCNSRRSYNVRALTLRDVKEIYETLGVLESAMVGAAAKKMTREDLGRLRCYNQAMRQAAAAKNLQAFGRWNRKFHEVFLSKAENRTLVEVCDSVRQRLYSFPVGRRSLSRWLMKSVREHDEILRRAAARDPKALASYFRDVHWCYERNFRFIEDAFDHAGEAAAHPGAGGRPRPGGSRWSNSGSASAGRKLRRSFR